MKWKFVKNYEVDMFENNHKIIVGYNLNNFTTHYHNIIEEDEKLNIISKKKFKKEFIFWKLIFIRFLNVETDPRLQ